MSRKNKNAIRVIRSYKFKQLTRQFFFDLNFITGSFGGSK